jgi:TonB family protein
MSPEAVGLAALLHVLVALALWWMAVYRPATVPPEDPVEITFEQPKPPPEPPKPPSPEQAQKPPQPPPPATPPVEGLKPPAKLEADKATQRRPSGDAPKDIAGPQPDSMEREVPALPPPPPPPQIEAKPEPKPSPPVEQKPVPQPPPPEIAAARPEALPPPPPPSTPREQPAPQPAPAKPSAPAVTSVQPQQHPQPTPPRPPPALSPRPQLQPSPLNARPQQQPPAIANRGDAPSSSPFVNPADEKNRATAEQNYLWEVVRKLRGYRYHANVPMAEGLTVVVVVIARDGRLLNVQVVRSSGVAAMDQGVLDGVRQGSPYTPLPPSIAGPSATFRLPLVSVPEGR